MNLESEVAKSDERQKFAVAKSHLEGATEMIGKLKSEAGELLAGYAAMKEKSTLSKTNSTSSTAFWTTFRTQTKRIIISKWWRPSPKNQRSRKRGKRCCGKNRPSQRQLQKDVGSRRQSNRRVQERKGGLRQSREKTPTQSRRNQISTQRSQSGNPRKYYECVSCASHGEKDACVRRVRQNKGSLRTLLYGLTQRHKVKTA